MNNQIRTNKEKYFKFSCRSDYGTDDYADAQWEGMTNAEWISGKSIDYSFTKKGRYIVVVWAAEDTNSVDPNGVSIVGWSINVDDDTCKININGHDLTGNMEINSLISFTVNASNDCSSKLYYRFSLRSGYGTSGYESNPWETMTEDLWVDQNILEYTFTEKGKYIVVVWVTDDITNVDPASVPIIGWSVSID